MALGWVGGIRSSVQFIYKIVNTLRDLPLHFCEVSFYKSPFKAYITCFREEHTRIFPLVKQFDYC